MPPLEAGLGADALEAVLRFAAAFRAGARFLAARLTVRLADFLALVERLAADFRTFFALAVFLFAIMILLKPGASEPAAGKLQLWIVHHPERLQVCRRDR
jgi:hypothetical protein